MYIEDPESARRFLNGHPYDFDRLPCLPPVCSIREAALALGVSSRSIERLIESGTLPSAGGGIRKKDLIDLIDASLLAEKPVDFN